MESRFIEYSVEVEVVSAPGYDPFLRKKKDRSPFTLLRIDPSQWMRWPDPYKLIDDPEMVTFLEKDLSNGLLTVEGKKEIQVRKVFELSLKDKLSTFFKVDGEWFCHYSYHDTNVFCGLQDDMEAIFNAAIKLGD